MGRGGAGRHQTARSKWSRVTDLPRINTTSVLDGNVMMNIYKYRIKDDIMIYDIYENMI